MSLRDQVDKRLLELRSELEKKLAAMGGAKSMNGKASGNSSLKGRKVPPKYRSRSGGTWAGRGQRPKWLVAALKKGKKMERSYRRILVTEGVRRQRLELAI